MVSFAPIMKKQTYWILARFIRALILTKDTDMDLSVDTRQDIFLYSSKMDLFPGFPTPNNGYPRTTDEWLCVSPYYKSVMGTDEMKSFMKRYGHMTAAMRQEERVHAAKEAQIEQARKEKDLEEEHQRVQLELEANTEHQRVQLELETRDVVENAELTCMDEGSDVTLENNQVTNQGVDSMAEHTNAITTEAGVGVAGIEHIVVTKTEELEANMAISHYGTYSDAEGSDEETSSTSTEDDSSGSESEDNIDAADFSTSMAIEATTAMGEEEFRDCDEEQAAFTQRVNDVKQTLEFAGVKHWQDESLHALAMSGPIGLSVWALKSFGKMRHEIKRATVMLKQIDERISSAQDKVREEREQAKRDLEVWNKLQAQVHAGMDRLSGMRGEDLKAKGKARGENQNSGGVLLGFGGGVDGKRRSVYMDGTKRKKKVKPTNMNPFETPRRVITPVGTSGERSETAGYQRSETVDLL